MNLSENLSINSELYYEKTEKKYNLNEEYSKDHKEYINFCSKKNNYNICEFEEFNNNINKIQNIYNKFDNFEINSNITKKYYINQNFIKKYNIYIKKNKNYNEIYECPVCYDNICLLNYIKLDCKHFLCKYCYEKWNKKCIENNIKVFCPLCRK